MHIRDLSHGDFVKVRSRNALIYTPVGQGTFELLPGTPRKRDKTWATQLVTGVLINNDPEEGVLRLSVAGVQEADRVFSATIPYSEVSMIHVGVVEVRYVTVPAHLKGTPLPPRIKYERVSF